MDVTSPEDIVIARLLPKKKKNVAKIKMKKKICRIKKVVIPLARNNKSKWKTKQKKHSESLVKRLYAPFNKFKTVHSTIERQIKTKRKINIELSSKERAFIINYCQVDAFRYMELKYKAQDAIEDGKVFCIYGNCPALRKALVERGWVEKLVNMTLATVRKDYNYDDMNKTNNSMERLMLSDLVKKFDPNLIWFDQDTYNDPVVEKYLAQDHIYINRLQNNELWTTKFGLHERLKNMHWHHIENVAEVNAPRTYSTDAEDDFEDFIADFQLTACTSLLKWILSMTSNNRLIFHEKGEIPFKVVMFAINRCKDYLLRNQHKDIDHIIPEVTEEKWSVFLKNYYILMAGNGIFHQIEDNILQMYLKYAKFLLMEIHKKRPQLSCEGCHNIWILKPAHCSRGRGIRLASKLRVILDLIEKTSNIYVIQKYIEEPLLIHKTKFDIRIYYLVTNTYPLHIYVYKDCYLKFSSQNYNLKDLHESIHLTNNAVQRKYNGSETKSTGIPSYSMWNLDTFKDYLASIYKEKVWDNITYPAIKKAIVGVMLASQDSLPSSKNRFELFGCDFILDNDYNPWLIEINSYPDLKSTTPVTQSICPKVITDVIKVVLDKHSSTHPSSIGRQVSPNGFTRRPGSPNSLPRKPGSPTSFTRRSGLTNSPTRRPVSPNMLSSKSGSPNSFTRRSGLTNSPTKKTGSPITSIGNFELVYKQAYTLPRYGCGMLINGFSLPPGYFYKGPIHVKDSFEDLTIEREEDIQALLEKIKDKNLKVNGAKITTGINPNAIKDECKLYKNNTAARQTLQNRLKSTDNKPLSPSFNAKRHKSPIPSSSTVFFENMKKSTKSTLRNSSFNTANELTNFMSLINKNIMSKHPTQRRQ